MEFVLLPLSLLNRRNIDCTGCGFSKRLVTLYCRINGKPIQIHGAGWTPDLLLRSSAERQKNELRYVRQMNLNAIRSEGKFESDSFYSLADELGILLLPGWACCDSWQRWDLWKQEQKLVAMESLRSQVILFE